MIGRSRRVVNTTIGDVHRKARSGELLLREALAGQKTEVAGAYRVAPRQIARDDLVLPFIALLRDDVGLDGDDIRSSGKVLDVFRGEAHDDVGINKRRRRSRAARRLRGRGIDPALDQREQCSLWTPTFSIRRPRSKLRGITD